MLLLHVYILLILLLHNIVYNVLSENIFFYKLLLLQIQQLVWFFTLVWTMPIITVWERIFGIH